MLPGHAAGFALALLAAPAVAAAAEPVVSRAAFAGGVSANEPVPEFKYGQPVAAGPLWFWTEISADASAIDWLRQHKRLPLKHEWYNFRGGAAGGDQKPEFVRDLEEIDDARIEQLASEARHSDKQRFTYRTASCRSNLPAGAWLVKVTDRFGNVLQNAEGRDARYEALVSRDLPRIAAACPPER